MTLSPAHLQPSLTQATRKDRPASANPSAESVVVPGKGLRLPRALPFPKWLAIGKQLSSLMNTSAWCLGDWLLYGENAFEGRYRDAVEQTSLDYQTLRNYAWVARAFCVSRRRDTLSFGHHAEVAALPEPEQNFWLRKAEELSWSRNQLRREVRASLHERLDANPAGQIESATSPDTRHQVAARATDRSPDALEIHISPQQMGTFQAAANSAGVSLQKWALHVLDQAARAALRTPNALCHISR